tara:strand:- start:3164 stop:3745 length:582 start_codon:yes stop_codon:yes gene_type:complete
MVIPMDVLLLSPYPETLIPILRKGSDVRVTTTDAEISSCPDTEFIVVYGYKHILRDPILSKFSGRVINLHVSLLPWNRGYDPNFWSWLENTPKGISIHQVDSGIDTGPILVQESAVLGGDDETLKTSYWKLRRQIESLFARKWPYICNGDIEPQEQQGLGSFHLAKDRLPYFTEMPLGWDTPVRILEEWSSKR